MLTSLTKAQSNVEYFPAGLNIQPFTANMIEPRIGCSSLLGKEKLRLDIGTSLDLIHVKKSDNEVLSFGADFFTYTRLEREKDFHFPVDAVDYLFGVNAGYKITDKNREYGIRARLSHISAHLVDGHYDHLINGWKEGVNPMVYSREFIELIPYYRIEGFRAYAGLTYLFHTTPKEIGKGLYQLGFDYYANSFISKNISPYIAYDFKLSKDDSYIGNNIATAGIKFGKYDGKGVSVYVAYLSGRSVHGEYFYFTENYTSIGFNLDL
jgi:Protein of unknown function (DUF1207).